MGTDLRHSVGVCVHCSDGDVHCDIQDAAVQLVMGFSIHSAGGLFPSWSQTLLVS